jgi:acetoin utilization deacetylase AcuC-like enzyme
MRKTAILKNDLFLEHIPDFNHVESPDRLRVIYEQLEQPPLNKLFLYPDFEPASVEALELNHTKEHVMRVAGTQNHLMRPALQPGPLSVVWR